MDPRAQTTELAADPQAVANGHVLVIGVGGLGCPALLALSAAGARHLTLVDDDVVDVSNLQRQVLFGVGELGQAKVAAAAWVLGRRDRDPAALRLRPLQCRLDPEPGAVAALLDRLAAEGDRPQVVIECSDSPDLKFAVHDACLGAGVPVVIGGVIGWRGQALAVDPRPGRSPRACYRCLFEAPPPRELAPACATVGVMGAVAGVVGHWLAALALGLLAPVADDTAGTLVDFDLLAGSLRRLTPAPRPGCPGCARILAPAPSPPEPSPPEPSPPEPPSPATSIPRTT